MSRVAVFGAGGFIGTACTMALRRDGHEIVTRRARRLRVDTEALARPTWSPARDQVARLAGELDGIEAVVNAAGVAVSGATGTPTLVGGNAAWPRLLADACAQARVPRLVHISTAAVQGRAHLLDESLRYAPLTPYARSKTLGEQLLRDAADRGRVAVTIYRPPSVHGPQRRMTTAFAAFCRRYPLVTCGDGAQPVPVALVGNVGAVVAAILAAGQAPFVVAHPYEGHTVRTLYETFAPGRPLHAAPAALVRSLLEAAAPTAQWLAPLGAVCRRAELLLLGQAQRPGWLTARGFELPLGRPAWTELAAVASRADTTSPAPASPAPPGTAPAQPVP
ncbi:NAD(P)-dependent oxidoreductase [Frankia sp. R82]|uniref:NAD-dependent epimerase/dehydratase family protein n=1 Tax=Frankia sp. R82 TaxID=2950553 RepID=UPI0020436650|nr:NAD(P)-dependent oxidoreductase [Frankia sp. R82]MCM3884765.1 NAD(P)-dependent oxidoreductase [Frankia sp. R82]